MFLEPRLRLQLYLQTMPDLVFQSVNSNLLRCTRVHKLYMNQRDNTKSKRSQHTHL